MGAKRETETRTTRNVLIFTVLILALGWVGRWIDGATGAAAGSSVGVSGAGLGAVAGSSVGMSGAGLGASIWIASPLVVSFLLRALAGDGWRDLGAKVAFRGDARWYAVSLLIYPVAAVIVLGINDWSGEVAGARAEMVFVPAFVALLLPQLLTSVFQESGFRGYLAPKLTALGVDRLLGHAIVGLVWGAWHLPYLTAVTGASNEPLATLAPRFLLGAIAASIVYGEIRLRTDSVWPAVLMHTVGGTFLGALVAAGHVPAARYAWLRMPVMEGGFMLAMFAAFGLWLYALAISRSHDK